MSNTIHHCAGGNALSAFRIQQLLPKLQAIAPAITGLSAQFAHLVRFSAEPSEAERAKVQALNDFLVFGTVAVASFGSGQLLHSVGWAGINTGMLPMVAAVLALLLWQARRQRQAKQA